MTELVVVSGKGGTGKTSLVGSLAALAQDKVLVDCDVDAADLHIVLQNSVQETNKFIGGRQASVIEEKCNGCGDCAEVCRFDALKFDWDAGPGGGQWCTIDKYACDGCGVCVRHCPEGAIDFKEVTSGEWFRSDTPYGPLLHARLGMAQANSGKLVSTLRQQARLLSEANRQELIIVDGPPGIGCPVIASITGASYVLLVTEPSVSAIHDMERLLELTAHFRIPTGICINKYDINPDLSDLVEARARDLAIPVLGRIRHDQAVTGAQLDRKPVVENGNSPAAGDIRILWEHVQDAIRSTVATSSSPS